MGLPFFGVDNVFNVRQYPSYVISADEEDTGREAFRVGDGRRSSLDFYAATTPNVAHQVKADGAVASAISVDYFALDRGHNLDGKVVTLERSVNDSVWNTVKSVTIPTSPGGDIDDANGCYTDEGAYIVRFTASAAERYLRLNVAAMGAGLVPRIVGLWAGLHWAPGNIFLPLADEDDVLVAQRTTSSKGWSASTIHVRKRVGELNFKLPSFAAFTDAATHIRDNFGRGRLMWIIHDDASSQRAVLTQRPLGRSGFQFPADWGYRAAAIRWEEYEPLVELPGS